MSCFLLDMLVFYNSFSFYVDLVQNAVILDHIRGPVNKKCEIPIILGGNFDCNGLTWPYNIKNDMNREKIELSEYLNRFGSYEGAFWNIVCRKLLIFFRFLPFFDISGTITAPDVTRFSQNDSQSCSMSRCDRIYSY